MQTVQAIVETRAAAVLPLSSYVRDLLVLLPCATCCDNVASPQTCKPAALLISSPHLHDLLALLQQCEQLGNECVQVGGHGVALTALTEVHHGSSSVSLQQQQQQQQ
jgi:hypothetical protein